MTRGERHYIEVPGTNTHELPPLLVRGVPEDTQPKQELVDLAGEIVEAEDMIALPANDAEEPDLADQRKFDLALHLTDQYLEMLTHWTWGDSILEWVRQCEITFYATQSLRHLVRHEVWPHAGRTSFIDLLRDKAIPSNGVGLERAVGMRLTFRQPPPISFLSNQFLFYLNGSVAGSAYNAWADMNPDPGGHLPPHRFHFEVHEVI